VQSAAFCWLIRRPINKPDWSRHGHSSRGKPSHLRQVLRYLALVVAKPAIELRQEATDLNCTLTAI
jgi:hypothetical protein